MGERTSHAPGTFSWVDLGTSDADGAKAFYGALLGWDFEDMPVPDSPPYSMARDRRPHRRGGVRQARRAGAVRVAVVRDRRGRGRDRRARGRARRHGHLGAVRRHGGRADGGAPGPDRRGLRRLAAEASIGAQLVNEPGALSLNQLNTSDPEAAQRFYGDLFGWTFRGVESGGQAYWGITNGERLNGGMMQSEPPSLARVLHERRRGRERREGHRAGRNGDRPAVAGPRRAGSRSRPTRRARCSRSSKAAMDD